MQANNAACAQIAGRCRLPATRPAARLGLGGAGGVACGHRADRGCDCGQLVASAVVVHWSQRGRIHWLGWRLPGLAVLAAPVGPEVLSQWFEHGWPWS